MIEKLEFAMSAEELQEAINRCHEHLRKTSKDMGVYDELAEHFRDLLVAQSAMASLINAAQEDQPK